MVIVEAYLNYMFIGSYLNLYQRTKELDLKVQYYKLPYGCWYEQFQLNNQLELVFLNEKGKIGPCLNKHGRETNEIMVLKGDLWFILIIKIVLEAFRMRGKELVM